VTIVIMAAEEFVLRWNNHQQNFATMVEDLWRHDTFTDVILCSEGRIFPAHRVILSACSPYFLEILSKVPEHQHPVVFLQGVPLKDLHALLTFMYSGEVVVSNANGDMASFFRTAENLQIKGLVSSAFPFATTSEPSNSSEGGGLSSENLNLGYPNRPSVSPTPRRIQQRPNPMEDSEGHIHQQQRIKTASPRDTSPQPARPPVGLAGLEQQISFPQHHSMLLSSLMGNKISRFSPSQTSRLLPSALPGGGGIASPPAGIRVGPVGPTDGPWLPPRQPPQIPQAPPQPAALYPTPTGPSFSRRGRPPSDVNAPRQEPPGYTGEASAPVTQPRPTPSAQNQVLRVTVVTPQGPVTMFQCQYCAKRFRRRDHLRQHIRTHTGEKPFQCNICGRRFSQSQQVRIHMRVHSDASGAPPLIPIASRNRGLQSGHTGLGRGRGREPYRSTSSEASLTESDVSTVPVATAAAAAPAAVPAALGHGSNSCKEEAVSPDRESLTVTPPPQEAPMSLTSTKSMKSTKSTSPASCDRRDSPSPNE